VCIASTGLTARRLTKQEVPVVRLNWLNLTSVMNHKRAAHAACAERTLAMNKCQRTTNWHAGRSRPSSATDVATSTLNLPLTKHSSVWIWACASQTPRHEHIESSLHGLLATC